MNSFFAIDTSNYTTSVALAVCDDNATLKNVYSARKVLDVPFGEKGLRQSNAHFEHTKALPKLTEEVFRKYCEDGNSKNMLKAISCSDKPRNQENSYMPCFIAGVSAATVAAQTVGCPVYFFSHQCMHIASAIYSIDRFDFFKKPHLAYHVSGGTTELLYVSPCNSGFKCEIIGKTLDISAGQLIDRVGVMINLKFPCGAELEKLAVKGKPLKVKITVNNCDMNLSGTENICSKMLQNGESREDVARYAVDTVKLSLYNTASVAAEKYKLPVIFVGGVSGNAIIKNYIVSRMEAYFAQSGLSSDNAVGTAILAMRKYFDL